jgi:hypothetical protein
MVGVCVGVDAPMTVTVAPPAAPGMEAGPTGGGPGWKALTRLDGEAVIEAVPAPIVVKERTATVTLPVGAESEVCDDTTMTLPFAFAVAGEVYVGTPVKPGDVPPLPESKRSRVLSKATAI